MNPTVRLRRTAMQTPLSASQVVVRVVLFAIAAIAIFGGALQMYLGQPETSARLDNVHRFMAGIYLFMGVIWAWAAVTVRHQAIPGSRQGESGREGKP